MNDAQKFKYLLDINDRAPHTRLNSALYQIAKKEKVEALRLPRPDRRPWLQRFLAKTAPLWAPLEDD